ncbi:MAG: Holliday junction branch migration protein RuvA [Firmicutes bacterium]|nr:Holliday junction branch migration protein RuvA [Bacillota bacterium]
MYNYLKGTITELDGGMITIEVGGVGWHVFASEPLFISLRLGESACVFIYLDIKETSQVLYGFSNQTERELFKTLLTVTGVGAKSAIALLSLGVNSLVGAIAGGNSVLLAKVKGVSAKLGEKVVLELRSKILKKFSVGSIENQMAGICQNNTGSELSSEIQDAIFGLMSLGMTKIKITEIIEKMDVNGKSAEELIIEVLSKR